MFQLESKDFLFYFVIFFLCSCAQIIAPTGGEKDIRPPEVFKTIPKNFSTNFTPLTNPKIEIVFDEYIQLSPNWNKELMISPGMKEIPNISVRGKSLFIKFSAKDEENLQNNTTYILDFGNSISDITEKNSLANYKYIFSTGDKIDSLTLCGEVVNAFTNKPEENIYVFLYDNWTNLEDSLPYKTLPTYYTKTDKTGKFEFNYIKKGNFKIFALNDKNSNFLYDLPSESIAFLKEPVEPYYKKSIDTATSALKEQPVASNNTTTTEHIKLYLFEEKKNIRQKINNISLDYRRLDIVLNLPSVNIDIFPVKQQISPLCEFKEVNHTKDTVIFWLSANISDSLVFEIKDDTLVLDTLNIMNLKKRKRGGTAEKPQLRIKHNVINNTLDIFDNLCLTLSNPVKSYDSAYGRKILLLLEKDTIIPKCIEDTTCVRRFIISHKLEEKTDYVLNILPGAFTDIYDLQNDTFLLKFKTTELSDYGSIILNLSCSDTINCILQLLDMDEKVINEKIIFSPSPTPDKAGQAFPKKPLPFGDAGGGLIIYQNLKSAKYKFRIICDENGNGKWDTGDYLNNVQPEKVIYYPQEIQVRSNWDVGIEWKMK